MRVAMEDLRLNELRIICSEKNSAPLGEGISIHGIETPCLMKEARRFAGRRYSEGWRSQDGGAVSRGVPKIRIAGSCVGPDSGFNEINSATFS